MKSIIDEKEFDLVIIGGGPGGMAAAIRAAELGIEKLVIIERDNVLGGILPQCIHNGFGLKIFQEELTGPEYAQIYVDKIKDLNIRIMFSSIVLSIDQEKNIVLANDCKGIHSIKAKSIILALGSRERTRGAINIPGSRPSGIYTAGFVQRMVNIEGYLPGSNIVILGSGDIGLIMARRLQLEGCSIKGVYELMSFSSGLRRNIVQCLNDYNIPLFLNHTVSNIYGDKRIEEVEVSEVDNRLNVISSSRKRIPCDTLMLSVGLIPENELSKTVDIELDDVTGGPIVSEYLETSVEGIFACGNSLHINDIVDNVTEEGNVAAESALSFLNGNKYEKSLIDISPGENVVYVVPQRISGKKNIKLNIRAKKPIKNAYIESPELGFRKKIRFVNPGELICLTLEKDNFNSLKDFSINLNIKKLIKNKKNE
jgi:NADPH-dependent 2,4-dienoyl-CoA reductase/sulfur reductase-like enzyme